MARLRLIASCRRCGRQFDAGDLPPGRRFRCACGDLVEVPEGKPHEAAVVRCSACGAPREAEAPACRFCGADFTLHERDLDTLCPSCFARISGRARFCHHCATAVLVEEKAGEPTDRACPACGPGRPLASRRLGATGASALECGTCGGLFLGNEAFRLVADRARAAQVPAPEHAVPARPRLPGAQRGPLYRPCPRCGARMNRQNYGRSSGVVVDLCRPHGVWLDADELDRILGWIRGGGSRREDERRKVELEDAERELRAKRLGPAVAPGPGEEGGVGGGDFFDRLVAVLAGAGRVLAEMLLR